MAYQVVWSNTAESDFDEIIEYISNKQSPEKAKILSNWVYRKIDLIALMPLIRIESQKIKPIRRILLSKHYSLLYQIEKYTVILIRFLDNRSAFIF